MPKMVGSGDKDCYAKAQEARDKESYDGYVARGGAGGTTGEGVGEEEINYLQVVNEDGSIAEPGPSPEITTTLGGRSDWVMEDDGDHMTYKGGCDRQSTKGKGRYDLISPVFLRRLAIVLEKGAEKYEERNWEKGMPLSRCLDSAMRHISQLLDGQDDEDHAGQAACNLMFYIHLRERVLAGNLDEKWDDLPRERNLC